jgi:NitT/TauT family transport system substrate-binding protein
MDNRIKIGIAVAITIAVIVTSIPATGILAGSNGGGTTTSDGSSESKELRIGYFPNINHAQAVIGLGNGDFQEALGDGVTVKTQLFSAGPSAIEALFANQIDVTYIGPNPAINGYVESNGEALRIISGAASGGAVFVIRNDAGIDSVEDFANKKFASPQLGNTQDVALRKYLLDNGYQTKDKGGNVEVLPAKNADIVTLMMKKEIDGAWVPEPWGAKLVKEANARIFLDERELWPEGEFVTAHIIARTDYLEKNPEIISRLLEAHITETEWINEHQDEAIAVFNAELEKLTGKTIPEDEFKAGLSRMTLTWDPVKESLAKSANDAFEIGFFDEKPDLEGIYDLDRLNQILGRRGLEQIQ